LAGVPWALASACGGDDDRPPTLQPSAGGTNPRPDVSGTGGSAADAATDDAPSDAAPDVSDATGGTGGEAATDGPANCGDIVCRGHGRCVLVGSAPSCVCDYGYKLEGDTCIVDESCIKIRHLEDGCRMVLLGPPAIATFFAVDYCAGTAVLPSKLESLSTAFKILENGQPLGSESAATVIQHPVENYVTIAVDVSSSVVTAGLLGPLVGQLRTFVQSLKGQDPPVGVSVLVFGRFVAEYVAFTTNLDEVDSKLGIMQNSPTEAQKFVGDQGTALYLGTEKAIRATERIQRLRHTVTGGGVLSTGVAVIVTDGVETTNATLDTALIRDTLVNLISIGIGSDIKDANLTAIGRDGSFLAPLPEDMTQAFAEITQRVKEAPQRAYLMGYCTSATTGTPTVEVTLTLNGVTVQQTASCKFNAALLSTDPSDTCDVSLFTDPCPPDSCGGLLACGYCTPDKCCLGGTCVAPSATPGDCHQQDELCQQTGQVCVKSGTADPACVTPVPNGTSCSTTQRCAPGIDYCDPNSSVCVPVTLTADPLLVDQPCADVDGKPQAEVCKTLNCARRVATNTTEPHICRPPAHMFDLCSGTSADAICESGTSCRSSRCEPRYIDRLCSADLECASGSCNTTTKLCASTGACYFSWDEKMGF
jgi:hypothetical protein